MKPKENQLFYNEQPLQNEPKQTNTEVKDLRLIESKFNTLQTQQDELLSPQSPFPAQHQLKKQKGEDSNINWGGKEKNPISIITPKESFESTLSIENSFNSVQIQFQKPSLFRTKAIEEFWTKLFYPNELDELEMSVLKDVHQAYTDHRIVERRMIDVFMENKEEVYTTWYKSISFRFTHEFADEMRRYILLRMCYAVAKSGTMKETKINVFNSCQERIKKMAYVNIKTVMEGRNAEMQKFFINEIRKAITMSFLELLLEAQKIFRCDSVEKAPRLVKNLRELVNELKNFNDDAVLDEVKSWTDKYGDVRLTAMMANRMNPASRYSKDAKVMEVARGMTQLLGKDIDLAIKDIIGVENWIEAKYETERMKSNLIKN